jgi:hypothetical protein
MVVVVDAVLMLRSWVKLMETYTNQYDSVVVEGEPNQALVVE